MFDKILVANRGEIACRVIAAARKLGIGTVAVYSDADRSARHVEMADQSVRIGPPPASESYLDGAAIIDAALRTGAQAIHPGYGFLSENPDFVAAVEAAGLIFVGPPADAIEAMGLKDAAKSLMEDAGVPVVPGYHGVSQDPETLAKEADRIGYPVLIKARAGGGGKGMRLVDDPVNFKDALEAAQREGKSSFNDPACLIEKYITQPRHIEIQVFGDAHGNVVHLFERDCSLQRRHQKVIEEAPAPDMPPEVRKAMGEAAVAAAKAIGYVGAGTVEFIADGSGALRADGFWFMEMNTRLQVEHPVSEAITGLDFVELQLRIAAGEPLPFEQDDLRIDGWSFEARVYAEDVPKGFLPATGTLQHLRFPDAAHFLRSDVRVDSGVREGDEISPWYDPMIAKIIVHGPSRETALGMLSRALDQTHIVGTVTNVEFLSALTRHDGFRRGEVDTGLIARDLDSLTASEPARDIVVAAAALDALGLPIGASADFWSAFSGWRAWGEARAFVSLKQPGNALEVTVTQVAKDRFNVGFGETEITVASQRGEGTERRLRTDHGDVALDVVRIGDGITVFSGSSRFDFTIHDPLTDMSDAGADGDGLFAPMPGLVRSVKAEAGARVKKGQPLVVLEAMKMEHALTAPRDGIVAEVLVAQGDQVTDSALLVALEPEDG